MSDKAVEQAIAEQEKRERKTDRREILRPAPGEKPKMKAFQVFKKEFVEYTDGEKYIFKIVAVEPGKYRIGIAFRTSPDVIIGVLPRQFSPHIKRQYYRSVSHLAKILIQIAKDRGWKEIYE